MNGYRQIEPVLLQIAERFFNPHAQPVSFQSQVPIRQIGRQALGLFFNDLPVGQQVEWMDAFDLVTPEGKLLFHLVSSLGEFYSAAAARDCRAVKSSQPGTMVSETYQAMNGNPKSSCHVNHDCTAGPPKGREPYGDGDSIVAGGPVACLHRKNPL